MASSALVILDDASGQIKYGGGDWTLSTLTQWYLGTSYYPAFVDGTKFGNVNLTFQGTSVAFIGNIPDRGFSQSATVGIDGSVPYEINYGDPAPPSYIQWYQSPTLDDREHTISIGNIAGAAIDMVLVGVGPNTSLTGKTLFVDDEDTQIVYNGQWKRNTDRFNAGTLPDGYPIHNSTHQTSTAGDTATFRFTGTSVSVYGVFSWMNIGSLSASYSLDGDVSSQKYPVTAATPNYTKNDGEASNFLFYSMANLSPGTHTLTITITEAQNVAYRLDYMTYTPSFANLASMPNLPPLSMTSSSIGPSSSGTTPQSLARTGSKVPIGAIVGGVLGSVVIILLVIVFFWLRRRKQLEPCSGEEAMNHEVRTSSNPTVIYPFSPSMEEFSVHRLSSRPPSQPLRAGDPSAISPYMHSNDSNPRSSFTDAKRSRAVPSSQNMYALYRPTSLTATPATGDPSTPSPYLQQPNTPGHQFSVAELKRSRGESSQQPDPQHQIVGSGSTHSQSSLHASLMNQAQNPPAYDAISLYREHDNERLGRTT